MKVYVHEDAIALIAMEDYVIPEKKAEDPKSENANGDGNEITSDQSNYPEGISYSVVLNEKEKNYSIYNLLRVCSFKAGVQESQKRCPPSKPERQKGGGIAGKTKNKKCPT